MKILRATFLGVRGVPDITIDLTDPRTGMPHGVVAIVGRSGSGKTRMIEALIAAKEAIGAYGPITPGATWIGAGSAAKILVTFLLDDAERDYAGTQSATQEGEVIFLPDRARSEAEEGLRAVLERYSHEPAQGKLEYFPATRRIPVFPPFGGLGTAEQRIGRAAKDPRKYGFVINFLRGLEHGAPARAHAFAAHLAALSRTCRYVPGSAGEGLPRCLQSRDGAPVNPGELSDGEVDAVIFAATAVAIGLDHSLIFVDRPELHIDDLPSLVAGLSALGKDNQIFLASRADLASVSGVGHVVTLKGP
jgi:hypothetical protein